MTTAKSKSTKTKSKSQTKSFVDYLDQLEKTGHKIFVKTAPKLPTKAIKIITTAVPFVAIVLVAFSLPFSSLHLINQLLNLFNLNFAALLASLATAASATLIAIAIPGLFNMYAGAWKLVFYASLLSLLTIFNLSATGDLLAYIALLCISWYILFQIQHRYKK